MSNPRYYVEKVTDIQVAQESGMVRLTFGVSEGGKDEAVVQLAIHAGDLNKAFQMVGQKMQSTFGGPGGPGAPGGRPGGRPGGPGGPKGPGGQQRPGGPAPGGKGPSLSGFKDLTKD